MVAKKCYAAVFSNGDKKFFGDWSLCEKAVRGVSNIRFKSFPNLEAARVWADSISSGAGITAPGVVTVSRQAEKSEGDHDPQLCIYVDGSFIPSHRHAAWAWVAIENDTIVAEASGLTPEPALSRNIDGELQASLQAIQWLKSQNKKGQILHDYAGIAFWADGSWQCKSEVAKRYRAAVLPYLGRVEFCKVKAHSGDKWNEYVDELARKAFLKS